MATHETTPARKTCFRCANRPALRSGPNRGLCRFCALAYEALDAFWEVIVRRFPQAKFGDLSPERTIRLSDAAADAIEEWISNNVLPQEGDEERT
jgi:hypothetical protein